MSNKPTHYLSVITTSGERSVFTRIASLWPTEKGGLVGSIPDGVTITGRFVIQSVKQAEADA